MRMISKKLKLSSEQGLDATAFKLPESLQCSDVKFPIITRTSNKIKWKNVVEESDEFGKEIDEFEKSKLPPVPPTAFRRTESEYLNKIFVDLMPAIIETIEKAKIWQCLRIQKCFFNGIDHIAEVLWNYNPNHPTRRNDYLHIFNMPWVREYLKENPRPLYPKSWLWTEEYAASLIQKTVRQYFVQRDEEVQEMRDFWIKLKAEHNVPEIKSNPLLLKKFAEVDLGSHKSIVGALARAKPNKHDDDSSQPESL